MAKNSSLSNKDKSNPKLAKRLLNYIKNRVRDHAKDDFDDNEQIRLKEFCDNITELQHKFILSNSTFLKLWVIIIMQGIA